MPESAVCRARLGDVVAKRLAVWGLTLVLLWGTAMLGPATASGQPGDSYPVAQAEQSDAPSPSDSDDEVRLMLALLIAVAAVALLGTFVYWVRTGDRPSSEQGDSPARAEQEDTLG